ncbi:MAG: DUF1636 domain-containing protein [Richelia sp. RM2_1_2]|nr:DUF1636 domain-containing protein [Richelia sp. SM1_7_0]NJN06657.1 DUF1636 domain-containing protein [Richelia sp. RM1_1_1]NJO27625.1 DUF1636 domain-containing protein [Richelia sp. SL_2_1]NJO59232.1 DUF1636 domain-containing protein [Richelia sp. RM2_1_2]
MKLHTLFVCKSCSAILEHEEADDRAEGNQLLLKLLEAQKNSACNLNIEAVGCLWTCDTPCCVTFTCQGKYTYHFVNLPVQNIVLDLFQFSKLYRESKNGYILPAKMPEQLKSNLLVRIPPVPD